MSFAEAKNQIQMNLARIPYEIFRDLRLCVCVNPNRAEREFVGDLERDRLVEVFMSDQVLTQIRNKRL